MFRYILIGLLCLAPLSARAEQVYINKTTLTATSLTAASCAGATNWTGWVPANVYRSIVWEIFFDADGSIATTGVTMRCESSDVNSTTADAGYDIHILSDSSTAGTSTSITHTWNNPVAADEKWSWTVTNLPESYVNCLFTCTAGDSGDVITVKYKQVTP